MSPEHEKKVKNLQLALSMGGVAVNPFVTELIYMINKGLEEKDGTFNVNDAQVIFAAVQAKHHALQQQQQPNPGFRLPPDVEEALRKERERAKKEESDIAKPE